MDDRQRQLVAKALGGLTVEASIDDVFAAAYRLTETSWQSGTEWLKQAMQRPEGLRRLERNIAAHL